MKLFLLLIEHNCFREISFFPGILDEHSYIQEKNEETEREAQGIGRDMSCPRKLFLDERKSLF